MIATGMQIYSTRNVKDFGAAIAAIRKSKGIKQIQLARMIGVSTNAMCSIELGNSAARQETLDKILEVLGAEILIKA